MPAARRSDRPDEETGPQERRYSWDWDELWPIMGGLEADLAPRMPVLCTPAVAVPEHVITQAETLALAARLHADQRPRPLPFWEEPIPVFAGWPDAAGGYLLFTETYRASAERARAAGWPARELAGGHFHMLVEPEAVAEALLELAAPMG